MGPQCEECRSWWHTECLKLKAADYVHDWLCAACAAARPGLVQSSGDEDSEPEEEEFAGQTTVGRARRRSQRKKKKARTTAADIFRGDLAAHSAPQNAPPTVLLHLQTSPTQMNVCVENVFEQSGPPSQTYQVTLLLPDLNNGYRHG